MEALKRLLGHLTGLLIASSMVEYFDSYLDWGWTSPRLSGLWLAWEPHSTSETIREFGLASGPAWAWGRSNAFHAIMVLVAFPILLIEVCRALRIVYRIDVTYGSRALLLFAAFMCFFITPRIGLVDVSIEWSSAMALATTLVFLSFVSWLGKEGKDGC